MSVTARRIANVLAVLVLIALVAPFVVYAAPQAVGADHSFVVLTASMTPAIAPGDAVIVAERDPTTIREGEIVTFLRGNGEVPVTHRVVGVVDADGEVAFETKGDANDAPDAGLVPGENVLGTVLVTIPYIGYVIQFANSEYGFLALIVLPFGLLVANEAWTFYRRSKASSAPFSEGDDGGDPGVGDDPEDGGDPADGDDPGNGGDATSGTDGPFVVTVRTLEGAFLALLPFVPYSAYVAYSWRTTASITVAIAAGTTLLLVTAMLLPIWFGRSKGDVSEPVPPDADSPTEPNVAVGFDGGTAVSGEPERRSGADGFAADAEVKHDDN